MYTREKGKERDTHIPNNMIPTTRCFRPSHLTEATAKLETAKTAISKGRNSRGKGVERIQDKRTKKGPRRRMDCKAAWVESVRRRLVLSG